MNRQTEPVERYWVSHYRVDDDSLNRYVASVGMRLLEAQGLPRDAMRFHVLKVGDVNAYSLTHGAIGITLPMLLMLNSEEELAMILSHEIGHVRAEHIASELSYTQWVVALATVPLAPLNVLTGDLFRDYAAGAVLGSFSREHEREADDLAAEYTRLAGFDLRCAVEFYRVLGRSREILQAKDPESGANWGVFSTHPGPEDRFARIAATIEPAATGDTRADEGTALPSCDTRLLDEIDGMLLSGPPPPVFVGKDGAIFHRPLSLRISQSDENPAEYMNGWFYVAASTVSLKRYDRDATIEWAADRARELIVHSELILLDTSENRGRRSVRVVWRPTASAHPEVEFRHWIEVGGRLYRISSQMSLAVWEDSAESLLDFAERIEPLDRSNAPRELLQQRVELHEVLASDTLESLAKVYPDATATELALTNGLEPG